MNRLKELEDAMAQLDARDGRGASRVVILAAACLRGGKNGTLGSNLEAVKAALAKPATNKLAPVNARGVSSTAQVGTQTPKAIIDRTTLPLPDSQPTKRDPYTTPDEDGQYADPMEGKQVRGIDKISRLIKQQLEKSNPAPKVTGKKGLRAVIAAQAQVKASIENQKQK